jgi:hypothetical protein
VPGSTTGMRAVYGEGAGQGEAERGSPRRRHGGAVEEGLQGGGVLQRGGGVLWWSSSVSVGTCSTCDEGSGERRSHRGRGGWSVELTGEAAMVAAVATNPVAATVL